MAGEYGVDIGIETLTNAKRTAGSATPDLIRLKGARLAFTSEPDQTATLKGDAIKRLASRDKLSGRALYGQQLEWSPTHTLHMATNHLLTADDPTIGAWRRVALIPWNVRFVPASDARAGEPVQDPGLPEELASEAAGILAWVVRGAMAFHGAGASLDPRPASVAQETAAYQESEDLLGDFIANWLTEDAVATTAVTSMALHIAYQGWASDAGIAKAEQLNSHQFGRAFAARYQSLGWPVRRARLKTGTVYYGINILKKHVTLNV